MDLSQVQKLKSSITTVTAGGTFQIQVRVLTTDGESEYSSGGSLDDNSSKIYGLKRVLINSEQLRLVEALH